LFFKEGLRTQKGSSKKVPQKIGGLIKEKRLLDKGFLKTFLGPRFFYFFGKVLGTFDWTQFLEGGGCWNLGLELRGG